MNNERRTFLASAGTIGIASLLAPGGVFAQMSTFGSDPLLTRDDYAARIKEWFYLHNADATLQSYLQLVRVIGGNAEGPVQQFALKLRSNRQDLAMPSGYYEVAGEPFSLFVKHTHKKGGRQFYRAEFALLQ